MSGNDYQLDDHAKMGGGPLESLMGGGFNFVPKALKGKMKENVKKLKGSLLDKMMDYGELDPDELDDGELDDIYEMFEDRSITLLVVVWDWMTRNLVNSEKTFQCWR